MARDQIGRIQRVFTAAQGDVNRAAAQISKRFAKMQLQPQRRMLLANPLQRALKRGRRRHAGRHGEPHLARDVRFQIVQREAGIAQRRAQTATILRQRRPRFGRTDAAGTAVQQLDPVQMLQPRDVLTHRRRRHRERLRRGIHAAVLKHGGKNKQRLQIIHHPVPPTKRLKKAPFLPCPCALANSPAKIRAL